jgi:hypothetical protein
MEKDHTIRVRFTGVTHQAIDDLLVRVPKHPEHFTQDGKSRSQPRN